MGDSIVAQKVYKKCPVIVVHRVLLADLIELDMVDFDVILGMDWLYSSYSFIGFSDSSGQVSVSGCIRV